MAPLPGNFLCFLFTEDKFVALMGSGYLEPFAGFGGEGLGGFYHLVQLVVAMFRVVMEQNQFFNTGIGSQGHGGAQGTVSPADVALVFFIRCTGCRGSEHRSR